MSHTSHLNPEQRRRVDQQLAEAGLERLSPLRAAALAKKVGVRDHGRCRDPFCDAPIRHIDHIRPYRAGGPTDYTNGRGVCARGNYIREMPGWHIDLVDDGLTDRPHTVRTTTPTGHTYISTAGPAP